MSRVIWGVDSAAAVSQGLYDCVVENFGHPDFWGRYLNTIPNVSDGLTPEEITFLKTLGIKVMPIYNNFAASVGYREGRVAARNAIFNGRRLGIQADTVIFANIENFFAVDADWLAGWVDVFLDSQYQPGFYHDPITGPFNEAFCLAASLHEQVRTHSILWSAELEPGVSPKGEHPRFNPATPACEANVWAWQYGRDAAECPIDTVLIQRRLYDRLH